MYVLIVSARVKPERRGRFEPLLNGSGAGAR